MLGRSTMSHQHAEDTSTTNLPSGWRELEIVDSTSRIHQLLAYWNETTRLTSVVGRRPYLRQTAEGAPQFSLAVILSRQPNPAERNVHALIVGGRLSLTLEVSASKVAMDVLRARHDSQYVRLFSHQVHFRFEESSGQTSAVIKSVSPNNSLVSDRSAETTLTDKRLLLAEASGTDGWATLSTSLNRPQTLHVLQVLDGADSQMRLVAEISYRPPETETVVRLSGRWADIHDYLMPLADVQDGSGRWLTATRLHQAVAEMLREGVISLTGTPRATQADLPPGEVARMFMYQSAVVLLPNPVSSEATEKRYQLRARPHPSFALNYTERYRTQRLARLHLDTGLSTLLFQGLSGRPWESHVQLMVGDANNGESRPVRRRMPAASFAPRHGNPNLPLDVAATHGALSSVALMMQPHTGSALVPKPGPALTRPIALAKMNLSMLDDLRLELPHVVPSRSLPVITQTNAPFWPDRLDDQRLWYAPELEAVEPAPNTPHKSGPFSFVFERIGATSVGQPALRAQLHLVLRPRMSTATSVALRSASYKHVVAVPIESLVVTLQIPFIDAVDGSLKRHSLVCQVKSDGGGQYRAHAELLNEWVRLCYGALAVDGFQAEPASFQATYMFPAYQAMKPGDIRLAFGAKALRMPVIYSETEAARLAGQPYFDAVRLAFITPERELHFRCETAQSRPERSAGAALSPTTVMAISEQPASTPLVAATSALLAKLPPQVLIRPQLNVAEDVAVQIEQIQYAVRTQVYRISGSVHMPCNRFGHLYRERVGEGEQDIGCQDALALGMVRYRLYEELESLRDRDYRVYQLLPQPGHFLVAPSRYVISRRAAGEEDEYRPLIFLHAVLDHATPVNNRVNLRATLQPDLSEAQIHNLVSRLAKLVPNPVLEYPTEVQMHSVEFTWLLADSVITAAEADVMEAAGPFVRTLFTADLAQWQLLHSLLRTEGLSGNVSFTLPDGLTIDCDLLLKLDHIRGPWGTGPVKLKLHGNKALLVNRIEQPVLVTQLDVYAATELLRIVPVELTLDQAASVDVEVGPDAAAVFAQVRFHAGEPMTIDEIRTFVEDIHANVVFVNLLNFANHNLTHLEIEAKVKGLPDVYRAQLTQAMPVADVPIVLSLTRYLEDHIIEYRLTKVFGDGTETTTSWKEWDLENDGPVSITSAIADL